MSWDYRLPHHVVRNLKRLPRKDQERIIAALEEMKVDPFSGDLKLMQGESNLYRRRVGNYRIYFRPYVAEHLLDIPEITRRQSH